MTITDVKVPIGMSARAREILDETNAKRGLVGGFGRVRGSNDLFRVEAKGTTETLHQWYVRLCTLHPWGLILRVDVHLDIDDEDVICGYHELDRDSSSKALVNSHSPVV